MIATSQIPSTVRTTITNYEGLLQNTNFRDVVDAVNGDALQSDMQIVLEALATMRRAEQYRYSLQFLKTCFTELSPEARSDYAALVEVACGATQRAVAAVNRVNDLFDAAGLSDFLSEHGATLFWQLPYNPFFGPPILRVFAALGIREQDIERAHPEYTSLELEDWDLLRLRGNDGTFLGLVKQVDQEARAFQERAKNGIPDIEGREPALVVVGIIVVVFIVVCLATHGNCEIEIGGSTSQ